MNKTQGRLNVFQRVMLFWNSFCPYNAVHVAKVPGELDAVRLKRRIDRYLEKCGLGGYSADSQSRTFRYAGGLVDAPLTLLQAGPDTRQTLDTQIASELNRNFLGEMPLLPFRFFAIPEEGSFYLGLAYFHPVAGADSVILLLKNILKFYQDPQAAEPEALSVYPESGGSLKGFFSWFRALPRHIRDLKNSYKPFRSKRSARIGFRSFSIGSADFKALCQRAKKWDVTVNDLFMAVLLEALSSPASGRHENKKRKKISIASIAGIRKDVSLRQKDAFGLFLSSFTVSHEVPKGISLRQLARDVRRRTEESKRSKAYLGIKMEMAAGLFILSFLGKDRREKFFRQNHPLWGGVTNIDIKNYWAPDADIELLDYQRGISTSLAYPLVFSMTSVNNVLNISASFDEAVFNDKQAETIISVFLKGLTDPGEKNELA